MDKYGTHGGITCDMCAARPLQGFRYKCKNCPNHDLCEACHARFNAGQLTQDAALQRVNKVSANLEDHVFEKHAERDGSFVPITGSKGAPKVSKKTKPNEPCPCGSGSKYKKCCGK